MAAILAVIHAGSIVTGEGVVLPEPLTAVATGLTTITSNAGIFQDIYTCIPSGGTAPYTYQWTTTGQGTINNSTDASTSVLWFSDFAVPQNVVVQCRVTDSEGQTTLASRAVILVNSAGTGVFL